ncbi:restriction endonuclease subunit S [Priestia megaterium]|uniref:restriction endonuclease subunit S n=1 Tax=Priestia megaterium TaxID=1404 RepID=UPI003391AB1F
MKEFTVKQLFHISKGKKVEQVVSDNINKVRLIQIEDLRNNDNIKYCVGSNNYVYATEDDVIIAWDGANAGTIGYNLKGAVGSTLAVLKRKREDFLVTYVAKFLQSKSQFLRDNCTGATIPHISRSVLEDIVIPIPSIEVQSEIVKVLNKAQFLIDKRKEQLLAMSELTQSVFLEMFGDPYLNNKGWEVQSLGEVANIVMGQSPPGDSYNLKNNGLPLLNGPAEFTNKYPLEKQWTTSPKKTSEKGDILFCVRGATAGRMNFSDKTYAIGRGLAAIKVKNENDLHFVFLILKFMYNHFQNTSNGSTFINIDKKTLENIPIFKVSDSLKERYFNIIEGIEKQKTLIEHSLDNLEANYGSLINSVFRKELFTA